MEKVCGIFFDVDISYILGMDLSQYVFCANIYCVALLYKETILGKIRIKANLYYHEMINLWYYSGFRLIGIRIKRIFG